MDGEKCTWVDKWVSGWMDQRVGGQMDMWVDKAGSVGG